MITDVDVKRPIDTREPIGRCCAAVTEYLVHRTVQIVDMNVYHRLRRREGAEYGYLFESIGCTCQSRWLRHDWRQGDASFDVRLLAPKS